MLILLLLVTDCFVPRDMVLIESILQRHVVNLLIYLLANCTIFCCHLSQTIVRGRVLPIFVSYPQTQ